MEKRKKILWLSSWYPNRNDAFDGDFIQRHARAAAIYNDVHLIHVTDAALKKSHEEEWNYVTGLTEQIIYYKNQENIFWKFTKQLRWFNLYKKAIENYIQKNGLPDLVHVHVPWKAGLVALWMKKKYKIPFVITEHWGIYNNVLKENFSSKPLHFKTATKKIFAEATAVTTVSKFLGEGLKKDVSVKNYVVLPNVVDTSLFFFKEEKYSKFTFIHVSNMVPLKNVEGILKAFEELMTIAKVTDVQLIMIGNKDNYYKQIAEQKGLLNRNIFFKGEVPYTDVAKEMQLAHCLILNSDMENSPCVIGEALCSGLPVIATSVGGIPELVDETNSLLIKSREDRLLAIAMREMIYKYGEINKKEIAEAAREKFNYAVIGKKFDEVYKRNNKHSS